MIELSKTRIGVLATLGRRKMRNKHGLFLVEGAKSVRDIADSEKFAEKINYLVATPESMDSALEIAERIAKRNTGHPEVFVASQDDMKKISSLSTAPDLLAVCYLPERKSQEEILSSPLSPGLYLLLDDIQDPGNLGTIIRTAHWFGIKHIYASPSTVDIFNPKTIQSSMGSLGSVEVDYIELGELMNANPGIPVVGLLLDGENIFRTDLPASAFIVMGNEGNGISHLLREKITLPLTIPPFDPQDHSESLNVAIATAITLAQFRNNK